MRLSGSKKILVAAGALATLLVVSLGSAQQMKQPDMKTIRGTLIDLTCASKGHAMTGMWANTKDDHMMEDGSTQKGCGKMCLTGGQPAGLFDGNTVSAVFACNPAATLSNYSGKEVEVQGFWAAGEDAKSFVPTRIREGSGSWADVNCATMH